MTTGNKTCAACLQFQQQMESEAAHSPQTLECFAGLTESAVPVRVGQITFAYLQTGQVMLRSPSQARFVKVAAQLAKWNSDLDLTQLKTAYFKTRVMTRSQYDSILCLLNTFGLYLSTISNQTLLQGATTEPQSISRARRFIADHQSEEISLMQVAKSVHMSAFYFCKIFKKTTGFTFTAYLARSRIESVKDLLLNPHTRISEAAFGAGFQSLSQFNRVFRRVAGEAPTDFRDRLTRPVALPALRRLALNAIHFTAA